MLQNHYCVAALQHRLSYNVVMSIPDGPVDDPIAATARAPEPGRALHRLCRAGLIAALLGTVVLAAGCSPASSRSSTSTGSATYRANLAFAQCMRAHGLSGFPNPSPSPGFSFGGQLSGNPNSPAARAVDACEHLLAGRSTTTVPTSSPPGAVATDCLTSQPRSCDTPSQVLVAYGIQPLLERGVTGRGQTIVLLEFPPSAEESPPPASGGQVPAVTDIRQDLARFDGMFHLAAARLQVVNTLAHATSPWLASIEEVEDTEIAHAVAPDAAIREVLIPSSYTASPRTVSAAVAAALRLGLAQGSVISLSAGAGEQCFSSAEVAQVNSVLQVAQRDRVTVVVSTGDSGAATTSCPGPGSGSTPVKGVDFPASDPLTLAVGGTTLTVDVSTGAYVGETAWNILPQAGEPRASGGGFSQLFPRPAYQDGVAGIGTNRGVPDVSADADPTTGMALAFSGGGQDNVLIGAGGASAAAPLWAGVIALADQYAHRGLGFVDPALYRIGSSASYRQAFHDVTIGNNTVTFSTQTITGYEAGPGWDPVTGWGSPNAQTLVPLLARYASP